MLNSKTHYCKFNQENFKIATNLLILQYFTMVLNEHNYEQVLQFYAKLLHIKNFLFKL